jgi:hypothetical protein
MVLLFRALVSGAMVGYIIAAPTVGLPAVARVWMWYGAVDALTALLSIAILPPRHARAPSLLVQAAWSLGAAMAGFLIPARLLLLLFVVVPMWSIGNTVLALAGLQQVRTEIEARWLITIIVLAAATFAGVFLGTPAGDTTWLWATLAAGGVASGVAFLLSALGVKAAPQR